jgi:biotin carboxylase
VASAARVARALGLPGIDPEAAALASTKPGQLELAGQVGVPTPRHARLREASELAAVTDGRLGPWPFVVKPAATQVGKLGIALARDPQELARAFVEARQASADRAVEIEEFVPGDDVVLCTLFRDSQVLPVALLREDTRFDERGAVRGLGLCLPSRSTRGARFEQALAHARRLIEGRRLGWGLAFLTFRARSNGELVLIEIHFDLAGDHVAERLFGAAGIDLVRATLEVLCDRPPAPLPKRSKGSALRFLFAEDLAQAGPRKLARLARIAGAREVCCEEPSATGRVGFALFELEAGRSKLERSVDRILVRRQARAA